MRPGVCFTKLKQKKKKFSQGPQEHIHTLIDKLFFIIVVR